MSPSMLHSFVIGIKVWVLVLLTTFHVQGQDKLEINGQVDKDGKPFKGAIVKVLKNGKAVEEKTTNKKGKFTVMLDLNLKYTLEVTKPLHVTKRITVNTKCPQTIEPWPFFLAVKLFEYVPGVDYSIYARPMAKIQFFSDEGTFDYDFGYGKKVGPQQRKTDAETAKKLNEYKKAESGMTEPERQERLKERKASFDEFKRTGGVRISAPEKKGTEETIVDREEDKFKQKLENEKRKAAAEREILNAMSEEDKVKRLADIKRQKRAESMLEKGVRNLQSKILKDKLLHETEDDLSTEMQGFLTKAKSKRSFLEEIADSKRTIKQIERNYQQ